MKLIFKIVFLLLCVNGAIAQAVPAGTPTVNAPGSWYKIGWVQGQNGLIFAVRDTNFLPSQPGTCVMWQRPGIDTTLWLWTGQRPWKRLTQGGELLNGWQLLGNNITPANWIGSVNDISFRIRTNDVERIIIDSSTSKLSVVDGPDSLSISPLLIKASASTDLGISTGGLVSVNILNNGFVGIGNSVQPQERLHVEGNVLSTDAFILKNQLTPFLAEVANEGDVMSIRTISPDDLMFKTDNTQRARFTSDGYFNVNAKTNLLDTAIAPVMSDADSSDRVEVTGRTKRLIAELNSSLTASNGVIRIGNDFRLGGALSGNTGIAFNNNTLNLSGVGRLLIDTGRIVVGLEVDPLYPLTVKKIYDNVTQANFATTVGKYPIYADKDVRFTEDSMSMWTVPGDNAGLNILRYKGRSVMNFENNINRFTAHHAVMAFDKYPGFADTTIVLGRVSPLTGISAPTGFAGILAFGGAGSVNAPIFGKGWFSALSAEFIVSGNPAYNNVENAIWVHAGVHGSGGPNSVKNGYGVYINGFNNSVTNKYALYQQGTLDTVQFNGKIRIPNLTTRTDTTSYKPTVVDANGNLFRLTYWPVGSGGGGGITTLNTLTDASQSFATGTTGTDFNISSAAGVHTFNIPDASATARGLITTGSQTVAGDKTYSDRIAINSSFVGKLNVAADNLGGTSQTSTSYNTSGLILGTNTAAANNSQQFGAPLILRSNGWGTTAGTSQTADWRFLNLPIQGTTPTSSLRLQFSAGGGSFSEPFLFNSSGQFNATGPIVSSNTVTGAGVISTAGVAAGAAAVLQWSGRSTMRSAVDGNIMISNQAGTDMGILQFGGTNSSFPGLQRSGTGLIASLADGSAHTTFTAAGLTLSGLAGTGTRLSTVSSTGVLGAITNGTDGQLLTMVSGSPAWATSSSTLYTSDGTATNRTVTVSGYLDFIGGEVKIGSATDRGTYSFQNTGSIYQAGNIVHAESGVTYPYLSGINGTSKKWFIGTYKDGVITEGITIDTFNNINTGSFSTASYPNYSGGYNLFVGGAILQAGEAYGSWTTITSDATLSVGYGFTTILVDATAGNITITLPIASTVSNGSGGSLSTGIIYKFKRIDGSGNTVTIQTQGSDAIDGNGSLTLPTQWLIQGIQACGTNRWIVI